jgi:hypothetical protein
MIDLNTILNELNEEDEQKTPPAICYYPGGFKPPHEGHFGVVKDLAAHSYITKVIVLIGHKTRDGITKEQSKRIWDLYLATSPIAKVTVRISEDPSPIKDIFSAFDDDLELKAYVAGAKSEVEEQDYFTPLQKAFSTRVMPLAIEEKVVTGSKRLSGTEARSLVIQLKKNVLALRAVTDKSSTEYSKARNEYLNTYEALKGCFPEVVIQKGQYDDILKILGIPVLNVDQLQENQADGDLIICVPYHLPVNIEEDLFTINWWKSTLEETLTEPQDISNNVIADFIDFTSKALNLQKVPKITFSDDENLAKNTHSLGAYNPKSDELLVVRGPRLTADILRTLAHELIHLKQNELNPLSKEDGKTGSPVENEANAAAGILLRKFGEYRPEIFEEVEVTDAKADYKIYCDMDGVLVDFDRGYKELTGKEASFDRPTEEFWEPLSKAGAVFWIKLKWMPDGKQLWSYIKSYNPDLLSAPSKEESSKIGKFVWVKREMPGTKLILRQAERKQEFATPNSILIDDRADNIQRWKDAGGIGIHHTSTADTIQQLKDLDL